MALEGFVMSAVILLLVTSLTVSVFKRLGLGAVLGLLVAGMIVGPHTPGPLLTAQVDDLRHFTELGVVLLLFVIGLEMRPIRLWRMRREVLGLGSLQILLSGAALAYFLSWLGHGWPIAVLVGLTLALSSTAFVLQILRDNGEIASPHGRVSFSVLLMQDLAVVPLLAIVPLLAPGGAEQELAPLWLRILQVLGSLALVVLCGAQLVPRALERLARHDNRDAFMLVTMLAVTFSAWITAVSGLSMALGAFLMGMLLSGSRYNLQVEAFIDPFKGLLVSLFFVAVGMSIDIGTILDRPGAFLTSVVALFGIKITVMLVLGYLFGLRRGTLVRSAFLLGQGGEFGFVLLGSALALGVIDQTVYAHMVGIISLSMLATPFLARMGNKIARDIDSTPAPKGFELARDAPAARVVLAGYGRVGHVVATLLHSSGVPFIALDTDPACVARGKRDGFSVHFGDISDVNLLRALAVENASLVVLTVNDPNIAMRALLHLRSLYPDVPVIARARDLETSATLLEAGATGAYPEVIESSLRLAANALEMLSIPVDDVDALLRDIREGRYALVRGQQPDRGASD